MRKLMLATAAGLALGVSAPAFAAGDIIITYKDDVSTLDPAIGYDWQNWSIIKSLFDGLMDYKPGTTELVPDLAESYEITQRRQDLHLQAPRRREIHQRPRGHRRGRQILDRARARPGDAEPRRRLLRLDRRRSTVVDPHDHQVRPLAARRDLPARHGDQLRPCRAEGGGRGVRRRFRPQPGRQRRLQAGGVDARPAARASRRTPTTGSAGVPNLDKRHLRVRPGADRRAAPPAEGRGRRARRRHPAGAVPRGQGRPAIRRPDRRGRPAPHRLRDDERQHQAVRRRARAPGGQHGDQQGSHRPHHQQPRGAGEPAAAAVDAGLHQGLQGLSPTIRRGRRSSSPRPASPTASRPSSTSTTPTRTRASPRRSSRISRRSASRPSSSRWPRPTSSPPAATAARR